MFFRARRKEEAVAIPDHLIGGPLPDWLQNDETTTDTGTTDSYELSTPSQQGLDQHTPKEQCTTGSAAKETLEDETSSHHRQAEPRKFVREAVASSPGPQAQTCLGHSDISNTSLLDVVCRTQPKAKARIQMSLKVPAETAGKAEVVKLEEAEDDILDEGVRAADDVSNGICRSAPSPLIRRSCPEEIVMDWVSSTSEPASSSGAVIPRDMPPRLPIRVVDLSLRASRPRKHVIGLEEPIGADEGEVVLDRLRQDATQGNAEAQLRLGKLHLKGIHVPQDCERARQLFELSASKEHVGAQFALGFMYELGLGVEIDYAVAVHWYRQAADRGHAVAMFGLATMLSQGRGAPRNEREAFQWFRLAAESGDVEAQFELGDRLARGKGTEEDLAGAQHWLVTAAEGGSPAAQNCLGSLIARGILDPRNDKEALRWFSLSAWQHHPPGMKNLGDMYAHGRGILRDDGEAARWYKLAVKHDPDYAPALKALGDMYANGRGVPKNTPEALSLYRMASNSRRLRSVDKELGDPNAISLVTIPIQGEQADPAEVGRGVPSNEGCRATIRRLSTRAILSALSCQCRSRKAVVRRHRGKR